MRSPGSDTGRNPYSSAFIVIVVVLLGTALLVPAAAASSGARDATRSDNDGDIAELPLRPEVDPRVDGEVRDRGRANVIVNLRASVGGDDDTRSSASDAAIADVLRTLPPGSFERVDGPRTVPVTTLTVDSRALDALTTSPLVASVESDITLTPHSLNSSSVVGAQRAASAGWTGAGQTIAIVDSGVAGSHPFLANGSAPPTVAEACFSTTSTLIRSTCAGGVPMSVTSASVPGSGQPCDLAVSISCAHGTAVAGVALGGDGAGPITGIAPAASLISVKVFGTDIADPSLIGASLSDVNSALQWLYNRRADFPGLAAVNLSLGAGRWPTDCDTSSIQIYIHQLREVGIATIVAAGNDGYDDAVAMPACAPDAIAAASMDDATAARAPSSNISRKVALFAPGTRVPSADARTGGLASYSGTSLAAPAVAGAWAVLRQRFPGMSVTDALDHLRTTGIMMTTDTTAPTTRYQIPLVQVDRAMRSPVGSESLPSTAFTPVTPARLMDTRAEPTIDSLYRDTGAVVGGETRSVRVTGRGYVPAGDAVSISVNVTVTDPTSSGFLTVFSGAGTRPTASNLNFTPGLTAANLVMVPVRADGTIAIFNSSGRADVIIDVLGWYTSVGDFRPLTPARLMDTRNEPTVDGRFRSTGAFGPGESRTLAISGRGGVPSSGVAAVALTVTAVDPTASGYLTVHPTGTPRPTASNLNFDAAEIIPNMVITPVDALGRIQVFNFGGRTDIVVDVLGWFPPTPTFTPLRAARLLDTRGGPTIDGNFSGSGPIPGGTRLDLQITGRGGVPRTGVSAVVLNLTATEPTAVGFLTMYPSGITMPGTSSINVAAGDTRANLVIVPVGADGRVSIYNFRGTTHAVVDVLGWSG